MCVSMVYLLVLSVEPLNFMSRASHLICHVVRDCHTPSDSTAREEQGSTTFVFHWLFAFSSETAPSRWCCSSSYCSCSCLRLNPQRPSTTNGSRCSWNPRTGVGPHHAGAVVEAVYLRASHMRTTIFVDSGRAPISWTGALAGFILEHPIATHHARGMAQSGTGAVLYAVCVGCADAVDWMGSGKKWRRKARVPATK